MALDIYFFNSLAQFLVLAVIMTVIFALRKSVGSRAILLGFEMLLLTVLLRRMDEIGSYFGVDVFERTALAILSWVVILVLLLALVQVWRRRLLIKHIADILRTKERYGLTLQEDKNALGAARPGAMGKE